jgi:L-glutamine synthetase (EC 6.3.1.2)
MKKMGFSLLHLLYGVIKKLKSYNDKDIRSETKNDPSKMKELVELYYHCG